MDNIVKDMFAMLKQKRKEKGVTQEQLGAYLGMSQANYSYFEKNESRMSVEDFFKALKFLEFDIFEELGKKYFEQKEPQQETQLINIDANQIMKIMILLAESQQNNNNDIKTNTNEIKENTKELQELKTQISTFLETLKNQNK